ncbi:bifunctional lytic transglycosylase/C40 family peptidase, partial [Bacillus paranthracis]
MAIIVYVEKVLKYYQRVKSLAAELLETNFKKLWLKPQIIKVYKYVFVESLTQVLNCSGLTQWTFRTAGAIRSNRTNAMESNKTYL